jgi:tetratricopeptide (TPR) repeat protein
VSLYRSEFRTDGKRAMQFFSQSSCRVLIALLFLWVSSTTVIAAGANAPSKETLEQRLRALATLIESSTGAQQVESSRNQEAQSRRGAARVLHREAEAAFQSGDSLNASRLLDEAAKMMFDAVRLAAPEQVEAAKARRDFDTRMESTRALLDAQKRIGREKDAGRSNEYIKQTDELLVRADSLAARGDLKSARAALDQAYLTVKAAVRGMRSGDTLVRSLSFANKEEEYRYELDRNDTHLMLVSMLVTDKRGNAAADTAVQRALDEAGRIRKSAEGAAGKRDFDGGVRLLEDSTRELVRAIRGAGVYIPG